MTTQRFKAELRPSGRGGGGHLVEVPAEVVAALGGGGRTPVRATFNGVPYRGSIVRMGGMWCLGVLKAIMAEAGVSAGDVLDVVVETDEAPRDVEVPPDLQRALVLAKLQTMFDAMAFTHRREYVNWVEEAKKPETRERRIEKTIAAIGERARKP